MRANSKNAAKNSDYFWKSGNGFRLFTFYQINSKIIVFTIFMTIFASKNSREIVKKSQLLVETGTDLYSLKINTFESLQLKNYS